MAYSRTPALIVPPSGGFGGLAKPPPPSSVGSLARSAPLVAAKSDSFKVQQTWTGVTAPCAWDISSDDLEPVPMDFPLERTHRSIEGVDATQVAQRISEALRSHSIEAKFGKKPAKAKCKTNDLVSFRIRLYAGGDNGLPVIVEVQRRSGSASCFMKSCRAILAAAEGKQEEKRFAPPKSVGQMKCLQAASLPPLSVAKVSDEELGRAVAMIRSEQKDTNVLGLESLLSLTDPIKTSLGVATLVSKCVVLGDDKFDIRDDIRAFTDRDVFEMEDEDAVQTHADHVRLLALSVFANALSICSRDGCLTGAVEEQAWFKEQFMSALVDELKLCERSACSALQASRCIGSLLESSTFARKYLISYGLIQALEDALSYGKISNDLLAEESDRCLSLLRA